MGRSCGNADSMCCFSLYFVSSSYTFCDIMEWDINDHLQGKMTMVVILGLLIRTYKDKDGMSAF